MVGNAGVTVEDSLVTFNGGAGFWFRSGTDVHPTGTITRCNILSNAAQDGLGTYRAQEAVINLSVSRASGGASDSGLWDAPGNAWVYDALGSFSGNSSDRGYILDAGGTARHTFTPGQSGWRPMDTSGVRARANYRSCCTTAQMTIQRVRYVEPGIQNLELAAGIFAAGRVNARNNYWGVFPGVPDVIEETRVGSVDYQGFQPAAFQDVGPRQAP